MLLLLLSLLQNTATIVCGGFSRILTKNKHFWESGLETIEDSLQHWLNCEIGPVDGKEENGCCYCRLLHGCMIALALLLIPLIFQSLNTSQQKQHTHTYKNNNYRTQGQYSWVLLVSAVIARVLGLLHSLSLQQGHAFAATTKKATLLTYLPTIPGIFALLFHYFWR